MSVSRECSVDLNLKGSEKPTWREDTWRMVVSSAGSELMVSRALLSADKVDLSSAPLPS